MWLRETRILAKTCADKGDGNTYNIKLDILRHVLRVGYGCS
jgi:hypothetical protein